MLESGIIVAAGLIFLFCRLSWRNRLRMLSHPLAIDIIVFVLLNWLHSGTAVGVMTAAVAALSCSICLSIGRSCFGFYRGNVFVPGKFRVAP